MLKTEAKAAERLLTRITKLRETDTEDSGRELAQVEQELIEHTNALEAEAIRLVASIRGEMHVATTGVSKECMDGIKLRRAELARERKMNDPYYRDTTPEGKAEMNEKMKRATAAGRGFWGDKAEDLQYGR